MTAHEVAVLYGIVALVIFILLFALAGAAIAITRASLAQSGELSDDEAGDNLVLAVFMFFVSLVVGVCWPAIPVLLVFAIATTIKDKVKEAYYEI